MINGVRADCIVEISLEFRELEVIAKEQRMVERIHRAIISIVSELSPGTEKRRRGLGERTKRSMPV